MPASPATGDSSGTDGDGGGSEKELVDMFNNETGACWEQYRSIKDRILRGKPEELRSHHMAELLNQLDDLQKESASNCLYSLEDRVSEVRVCVCLCGRACVPLALDLIA